MLNNQTRKLNVMIFDSLDEMMTDLKTHPRGRGRRIDTYDEDWLGRRLDSWEQVEQAFQSPWPEGMKVYDEMIEKLRHEKLPQPTSIKRQIMWNEEEGEDYSFDRHTHDQPFLRTTKRQRRHTIQRVTIICNSTFSGGAESFDLIWRAAATTCLTELLERAGYRVEVWGAYYCSDIWYKGSSSGWGAKNTMDGLIAVCTKQLQDPLDSTGLINALSGWAFRTAYLGCAHLLDDASWNIDYGYGSIVALSDKVIKEITKDEHVFGCDFMRNNYGYDSFFDSISGRNRGRSNSYLPQAIEWIRNVLKKLEEQA
jgi:hypothetical protein